MDIGLALQLSIHRISEANNTEAWPGPETRAAVGRASASAQREGVPAAFGFAALPWHRRREVLVQPPHPIAGIISQRLLTACPPILYGPLPVPALLRPMATPRLINGRFHLDRQDPLSVN